MSASLQAVLYISIVCLSSSLSLLISASTSSCVIPKESELYRQLQITQKFQLAFWKRKILEVLTNPWDAEDDLSFSPDADENPLGEPISSDLRPICIDSKLLLLSMSDKFESRGGVRFAEFSMLSKNAGNMRSILGLPELTNDISVSCGGAARCSPPCLPLNCFLVKGDLQLKRLIDRLN